MKSFYALIFYFVVIFVLMAAPSIINERGKPYYTAQFNWQPVAGAASYRVHYGLETNPYQFAVEAGKATSVVIGGLISGCKYHSTVTAYAADKREIARAPDLEFTRSPETEVSVTQKIRGGVQVVAKDANPERVIERVYFKTLNQPPTTGNK